MAVSISASLSTQPLSAAASKAAPEHHVEVVRRVESDKWAWIEDLHDSDPHLQQHDFNPRQLQRKADVVAAFGTQAPSSADVLLHYAGDPPPGVKRHPIPVVLVHGASADGDFFVDPMENGKIKGTATKLREEGFQVYAVTYALNQDDNYVWSQQLANAIQRVKDLTGAPQVDLVAHSKGCVATRAYVSNFREDWMTPYRGDVHRIAFEASPFGGIDYMFRHPVGNYALYGDSKDFRLNAPMSWDRILYYGFMRDATDQGFGTEGRDDYPGQRQLLARMDQQHPLAMLEQDWYTSYNGGQGFVSHSQGIDHYIEQSGNFMPRLQATPIDPKVEVAVLAGDNPNIQGILNEYTGPSDGLLFLSSALEVPKGAKVVAEKVMHLNHLQLEMDPQAQQWTADVLAAENPQPLSAARVEGIREDAVKHALVAKVPDLPALIGEKELQAMQAGGQAAALKALLVDGDDQKASGFPANAPRPGMI